MALRYFQQQEQSYVPTYTPLNAEILSNTHQQIQAQGAKARQYKRDTFDVAAENVTSELSNLGAEDRQYAREEFAKSRKNLRNIIEEQGARNAMPFIDEEVNRLSSQLQPLRRASTLQSELETKAEESEAGPAITEYIRRNPYTVKRDDQGDPISVSGGPQNWEVETMSKWKNFDKVGDFVQDWKSDKVEKDKFTTEGYLVTDSQEQVSYSEVSDAAMQYMLNDSQYRAQLQLLGEKQLNQAIPRNEDGTYNDSNHNLDIIQDESGDVAGIRSKFERTIFNKDGTVKKDKNGNPVTKTFHKTFDSVAEWQAFKQAAPYAERESFNDVGFSVKESPDTDTSTEGQPKGNNYFNGPFSIKEDPTTYDKQHQKLMAEYTNNEGKIYHKAMANLSNTVAITTNKGRNVKIDYDPESEKVTVTQKYQATDTKGRPISDMNGDPVWVRREIEEEDFKSDSARQRFLDKKQEIIHQNREMKKTKTKLSSIRKATRQMLYSRYGENVKDINIAEDGTLTFSSGGERSMIELAKKHAPSDIHTYDPTVLKTVQAKGVNMDVRRNVPREQQFEYLETGDIVEATIRQDPVEGQREEGYQSETSATAFGLRGSEEQDVLVFRDNDGKIKFINKNNNNALSRMSRDADKFLNKFTNEMFGKDRTNQYNVAPINNDPKSGTIDDRIQNIFQEPLPQLAGTFKLANDPDQEMSPTPSAFFDVYGVFFRDGNPVVAGTYYDEGRGKDTSELEGGKRVFWEGNLAESMGSQALPDKFVMAAFDNQFRNAFSPIVHEGKNSSTIDREELSQMGVPNNIEKIDIEQYNKMVNSPNSETGELSKTFEAKVYPQGSNKPVHLYGDTISGIEDQIKDIISGRRSLNVNE